MHNAAMAALGLNWRYLAFEVDPKNLRDAIEGARVMQFSGVNLTVPHKVLAVPFMDVLDESAKTWGAVNTVRFEAQDAAGQWQPLHHFSETIKGPIRTQGFNTDSDGIVRALREDLSLSLPGLKVLMVGTGGAGQVAALRLSMEKASEVYLYDYAGEKAEAVFLEIQKRYPEVKAVIGFPKGPVDLVINATPLGWKETDPLPLDEKQFPMRQAGAVYDMVYRPAETKLLKAAKAAGCKTANGLGMLLYQGAAALEIWTGMTVPVDVMRQALEHNIYGH
jgi:shikimate dehydrogenase